LIDESTLRRQLEELSEHELAVAYWKARWLRQARAKQLPPDATDPDWKVFGICSGRGFGKTLAGANWIGLEAAQHPNSFNAVIAPTYQDARYTCFEGPTGLLAQIPPILYKPEDYSRSVPSLTLWNGAVLRGFAGDSPDRLRGPQHHRVWAEELAAWAYPEEAWSNMIFGLRLGARPRVVWTTTPRPTAFMRERMNPQPGTVIVTGAIHENADNLPDSMLQEIEQYRGSRIWEQEALGRLIDPEEGGIVKRSQWQLWPIHKPLPQFLCIVMSLDTAFTEDTVDKKTRDTDFTACSVWGVWEEPAPEKVRAGNHVKAPPKRHVLLLDAWQDKLGFPDLVARVKEESQAKYGETEEIAHPIYGKARPKHKGGHGIDMIVIEDKGSGISLRQALAREGLLCHAYNPGRADKLARLHLVSPLFAFGRVWCVESDRYAGRPKLWADPLITQVCSYSGEGTIAHDDLLDSTTAALRVLKDQWIPAFTPPVTRNEDDAVRRKPGPLINPYAV
jgi:predicted phage terminase large subunit-like protein